MTKPDNYDYDDDDNDDDYYYYYYYLRWQLKLITLMTLVCVISIADTKASGATRPAKDAELKERWTVTPEHIVLTARNTG